MATSEVRTVSPTAAPIPINLLLPYLDDYEEPKEPLREHFLPC